MIRNMKAIMSLAFASLALSGCYTHNFPHDISFAPTHHIPEKAHVYVDMNGTFYPEGWNAFVRPGKAWKAKSLLGEASVRAEAGDNSLRTLVASDQQRQLQALDAYLQGKSRVFIFIHGVNTSQTDADEAYRVMEQSIVFRPNDALIEFNWDGYVAKGGVAGISAARFWFLAVTNSQLAGSRGLRPILNLLRDQQAILVSHSRGASVILSALANPPYDAGFRKDKVRLGYLGERPLEPPPLREQGNDISVAMLAPAIGEVDFRAKACEALADVKDAKPCTVWRHFSRQLKSIRYTVNPCDAVLNKFVGLADSLNPTNLGLDATVGDTVDEHYPRMIAYPLSSTHGHKFVYYAADPEFRKMLEGAGVQTRIPNTLPAPIVTCQRKNAASDGTTKPKPS
jgi:hypothetical protein